MVGIDYGSRILDIALCIEISQKTKVLIVIIGQRITMLVLGSSEYAV